MDMQKLKRMLWMMNELITASPNGITQQELSDKWAISSKNDYKEPGLTPSTFHRIKNALKELFECEIIVNHTTNQYSVEIPDDSVPDEQLTLLDMLLVKHRQPEKSNSINDILQMLTMGNDIPADDMRAARDLSLVLKRLPFKYNMPGGCWTSPRIRAWMKQIAQSGMNTIPIISAYGTRAYTLRPGNGFP